MLSLADKKPTETRQLMPPSNLYGLSQIPALWKSELVMPFNKLGANRISVASVREESVEPLLVDTPVSTRKKSNKQIEEMARAGMAIFGTLAIVATLGCIIVLLGGPVQIILLIEVALLTWGGCVIALISSGMVGFSTDS